MVSDRASGARCSHGSPSQSPARVCAAYAAERASSQPGRSRRLPRRPNFVLLHPLSCDRIQRLPIDRIKHCERILLFPRFLRFRLFFFIQLLPPRLLCPDIPHAVHHSASDWLLPLLESAHSLLPVHALPGHLPVGGGIPQGGRLLLLKRDPFVRHLQRRGETLQRARSLFLFLSPARPHGAAERTRTHPPRFCSQSRPRSGPGTAPSGGHSAEWRASAWKKASFVRCRRKN